MVELPVVVPALLPSVVDEETDDDFKLAARKMIAVENFMIAFCLGLVWFDFASVFEICEHTQEVILKKKKRSCRPLGGTDFLLFQFFLFLYWLDNCMFQD